MQELGKDASLLSLSDAIGGTKELTDLFSINAEISNLFSTTDQGDSGKLAYDGFGVGAKFIAKARENAEFHIGLQVDFTTTTTSGDFDDDHDRLTVCSIPVGMVISF